MLVKLVAARPVTKKIKLGAMPFAASSLPSFPDPDDDPDLLFFPASARFAVVFPSQFNCAFLAILDLFSTSFPRRYETRGRNVEGEGG